MRPWPIEAKRRRRFVSSWQLERCQPECRIPAAAAAASAAVTVSVAQGSRAGGSRLTPEEPGPGWEELEVETRPRAGARGQPPRPGA